MYAVGLAATFGAAIAFGVQYVPVKKYEIYDGTTFQWFMCNGILFVGVSAALVFEQLDSCSRMVVCGGVLWGISNYLVLPLVKLLGIGLGFSMYHFVNLAVGYVTGRFGLFGVPPMSEVFPGSYVVCDFGCVLVLISFLGLIFVEQDDHRVPDLEVPLPPPIVQGIDADYREMYRRWRLGEFRAAAENPAKLDGSTSTRRLTATSLGIETPSVALGQQYSVGGFGMYSSPSVPEPVEEDQDETQQARQHRDSAKIGPVAEIADECQTKEGMPRSESAPVESLDKQQSHSFNVSNRSIDLAEEQAARTWHTKVLGVLLALAAGGICGVQSVPATLYNNSNPDKPPTAVIFPQCLGIWLASTVIYLLYASIARFHGWSVPHSVIRPAFFSGCIWAIGFGLMIAGIHELGYSVGYTLDAVGPILVSSLLSIFVFKEIKGRKQLMMYVV
eukprot:CAMPEP_0169285746 /NCGR_PEP_ID=MMETSP1016-20121227/58882_1 /TAXON_ID=342587 /ORGANISM="Karlodinium micrum, Strain CCMP2283" /LENGTH=444 /DNA_ID=CAMNT_0009375313 /DNA_START=30 /DNA_END=1360 /DNA_ORIENTATION=-